jgi:hypothetical protein
MRVVSYANRPVMTSGLAVLGDVIATARLDQGRAMDDSRPRDRTDGQTTLSGVRQTVLPGVPSGPLPEMRRGQTPG